MRSIVCAALRPLTALSVCMLGPTIMCQSKGPGIVAGSCVMCVWHVTPSPCICWLGGEVSFLHISLLACKHPMLMC